MFKAYAILEIFSRSFIYLFIHLSFGERERERERERGEEGERERKREGEREGERERERERENNNLAENLEINWLTCFTNAQHQKCHILWRRNLNFEQATRKTSSSTFQVYNVNDHGAGSGSSSTWSANYKSCHYLPFVSLLAVRFQINHIENFVEVFIISNLFLRCNIFSESFYKFELSKHEIQMTVKLYKCLYMIF